MYPRGCTSEGALDGGGSRRRRRAPCRARSRSPIGGGIFTDGHARSGYPWTWTKQLVVCRPRFDHHYCWHAHPLAYSPKLTRNCGTRRSLVGPRGQRDALRCRCRASIHTWVRLRGGENKRGVRSRHGRCDQRRSCATLATAGRADSAPHFSEDAAACAQRWSEWSDDRICGHVLPSRRHRAPCRRRR